MFTDEFLREFIGQDIGAVFVYSPGMGGEMLGRLLTVHQGIATMRCPTMDEKTKEHFTVDLHLKVEHIQIVKSNKQASVALARGGIR